MRPGAKRNLSEQQHQQERHDQDRHRGEEDDVERLRDGVDESAGELRGREQRQGPAMSGRPDSVSLGVTR
jgi:hypothetical protein